MFLESERRQVAAIGRRMSAEGLSNGTSGNLSIYVPKEGYMVLSPSGMRYEDIQPEDVVVMTLDGKVAAGERKPSSEWALHAGFYREKPEIRGVVHTHSPYCTTFAVLNEPIRAVHYAIAGAGTDEIPCAPYCTFGTGLLAERAVRYCGRGNAVLLGNHGVVCCGESLEKAYALAGDLEFTARLQYQARCIGTPRVLTEDEMAAALERFQTYGQQPKR